MAHRKRAHGAGMSPDNDLSRELTRARQKAMARRKAKKPSEPLLHPAEYKPQRVLIKNPSAAPQKKKKPPHS